MKINENKLWKNFSLFIRMRDVAPFTGYGACITCGRIIHYTKGDCGHGIPRQHKATKYHEQNNHLQCKPCNGFEGGARESYKAAVDKKYGPGTWDKILIASKGISKRSQFEVDIMADEYGRLAQEIKLKKKI